MATGDLLSAHRRRAGSCSTVLWENSGDFRRTISATNRTTIDNHDAYYFGNVDQISTPTAALRTPISHPEIPTLNLKTPLFSPGFIAGGRRSEEFHGANWDGFE
jgi:hypothetical protein